MGKFRQEGSMANPKADKARADMYLDDAKLLGITAAFVVATCVFAIVFLAVS
jgi:hypothetical protein